MQGLGAITVQALLGGRIYVCVVVYCPADAADPAGRGNDRGMSFAHACDSVVKVDWPIWCALHCHCFAITSSRVRVLEAMGKARKAFYAVQVGRSVGVYRSW